MPNLIPEGLSLLVGSPKLGKSWLALSTGIAWRTGGGQSARSRRPGDVLLPRTRRTPSAGSRSGWAHLAGRTGPPRLAITTSPPRSPGRRCHIRGWWRVAGTPGSWSLIPSRSFAVRLGNQNLYSGDYAAAGELKRVADDFGVAIVLVHHTRKATADDPLDTVSGTNGLAGAADTTWCSGGRSAAPTRPVFRGCATCRKPTMPSTSTRRRASWTPPG